MTANCAHPRIEHPLFDEDVAAELSAAEVREKYPRKVEECVDCGQTVILYASFLHFISGDW